MAAHKFCLTCGTIVPQDHNHRRWGNGSTRQWRKQRALALSIHPTCTQPGCQEPATEVHHVTDTHLRPVCRAHNPRGG